MSARLPPAEHPGDVGGVWEGAENRRHVRKVVLTLLDQGASLDRQTRR